MSTDSQRNYDLYEKIGPLLSNLSSINNNFEQQKKQLNSLNYSIDKMNIDIKKKEMDEKNLQWLYSLQERENKLQMEISQNEAKKAQLENLKKQNIFYEEQIKILNNENQKLKIEYLQIQQKNEQLISQQEIALKEQIKLVNEQFISRIVQLEAQLQLKQQNEVETSVKIAQFTNQIKILESQKQIFQQECEKFEIVKQTLDKEKEMYINEFRFLKENYMKMIDKLQEEVHKLKVQNHSFNEDNKSLKSTVEYYKNRFQDMMDLQEMASLNQDNSLLSLLKSKGMQNITKQDLVQARDQVAQDMIYQKGFQFGNAWDEVMNDISKLA
ncbi:unnamed protein product (macronuclear) [Paramecium tetraurelia]|uniref:Uncharacterized protein n=1 Tax=Paramecium tetraurelia TaxID=5888 RepID=A0CHA5_PARTE|nr:uncharacterized protein GSPATT00007612001 [Paramecium tetraurelia]CAK70172.1 unnamed protein product [Paramecium tetraurelia]|eukprot:XP_001437569.1 hypothetical protein (macronuclear) [Paramecium tetraurelia strain d4-2]